MLRPRDSRHQNPPRLQHPLQSHRRILRRIMNRNLRHIRLRVHRNRPIHPQHLRPQRPIDLHMVPTLRRARHQPRSIHNVISHRRIDSHRSRHTRSTTRRHRYLQLVVINRQRRHRTPISPHRIVVRPVLRLGLPRNQRVFPHHIAVHHLQPRRRHLVRHLRQIAQGINLRHRRRAPGTTLGLNGGET